MVVNGLSREQLNTKSLIYKINFPSNKCYIGVTTRKLIDRIYDHRECIMSGNQVLYKAFRKYGFENTVWEILDVVEDKDELFNLELFYVNKFKSNKWKYGYNMTDGGEGRNNSKHSKETLAKISGSNNHGAKINEELAEKIKIDLSKGESYKSISERYNVNRKIISNIKRCKDWKHVRDDLNSTIINTVKKIKKIDSHVHEIKTLMYEGWSDSSIAKKLEIGRNAIHEIRKLKVHAEILKEYNETIISSKGWNNPLTNDNIRQIKYLLTIPKNIRYICNTLNLDYDAYFYRISQIKKLKSSEKIHTEYNDELRRLYGK
jgi:group I intron endonuclease